AATRQLGLGYRTSSLSAETRQGLPDDALRAGDRAPDGALGTGRVFDALRGPHFTLLAVGQDTELPHSGGELVRARRAESITAYGTGLFLIRPDGYVAWAGRDGTGLMAYAESVMDHLKAAVDLNQT
ncbi:pentachlorophenol monooxygenase, partial [Streptomyces sp. NPDC059063]